MSANAIELASSTTSEPRPGIEDIVGEHSGATYRVALSVVRDHALAEDVVQESVVKAWQALDSFRGDANVRTWLLRITHNTAISALRKRRDRAERPARTTSAHVGRGVRVAGAHLHRTRALRHA